MQPASTALYRTIVALIVVAATAIGLIVLLGSRFAPIEASASAPELSCVATEVVYGTPVHCSGQGGAALRWPDGTESAIETSHSPRWVGDDVVALLDEDDTQVASVPLRITPDISLECQDKDEDLRKVYELERTDLRDTGWDYVFLDTAGAVVRPGDPSHPNGGNTEGLERIVLGEEISTGLCRISSQAGDDLDAEYSMVIVSPWEEAQTTSLRIIGPSSKTRWAGTQPAELTGTITVNNITASERTSVYQSGCN